MIYRGIALSLHIISGCMSFYGSYASIVLRDQLAFPPTDGPCKQNIGLAPLECSDPACVDLPNLGLCNIQSKSGG